MAFTSGLAGCSLTAIRALCSTAPPTRRPKSPSIKVQAAAHPTNFAALTLPLALDGDPRGTLVVYLDQTDQANVLSSYFGLIAAITLALARRRHRRARRLRLDAQRERREAEEQVRYLEEHDALTGLANRTAFGDGLADAIAAHASRPHPYRRAVSRHRQVQGDQRRRRSLPAATRCCATSAPAFRPTLREGDLIARLGGDEFAIALVDITNLGDVMAFMNRLVEALRRPLQVAGKDMLVTTSVGIALAPADGDTATTVLRHAGIALARAKGDGGQRMCFFEQSMDKALQRRRMVEHELRLALGREEFEVVYQPQYDLATERQCGSEALVRWHHPVHGKIAPGHFISVAEDTGLIVPLGEWVLRRACSDAVNWPEPLFVSVNLSPAQFRDGDVAETVAQVLNETGLPPERLELEITESLLINDTEEVLGKLNRLRQLGVPSPWTISAPAIRA